MAKNLTNNQLLIREYIKQEYPSSTFADESTFFEFFTATQVLKEYDLSDEEIENGLIGGGNDGGYDAIYMFFNDTLISEDIVENISTPKEAKLEIVILQSKNELSFSEDTIMKWKTTSDNLLQFGNQLNSFIGRYKIELLDFIQVFRDLRIKLLKCRLKLEFKYFYVSLATELHSNVQAQATELQNMIHGFFPGSFTNVIVKFVDANMLMTYMNSHADNRYSLALSDNPISIGSRKDYVALVAIRNYYRFIVDENGELKKHIFEANVRDYQGHNSVNNDIRDTLSGEVKEDFWWLNNGVTILASEASIAVGKELLIIDPEIVNGLQTSNEIYNYYKNLPIALEAETRNILIRVIVPEDDSSRDKIILATNNQTSIPPAVLRSTDPIHRQIEMYFKSRGLYYDRRKNYYKNQGKKPNEIISIAFLGQCLMSLFLQKPNYARARPSTLLNSDEYYNLMFIKNSDLDVFYKTASLGKKIERLVKGSSDFTPAVKSDILFYVLYFVVGDYLKNHIITVDSFKKIDSSIFSDMIIDNAIETVYKEYKSLGETSVVAKGSDLIQRLQELLANRNE